MPRKPTKTATVETASDASGVRIEVGSPAADAFLNGVPVTDFADERYASNADAFDYAGIDSPGEPTGDAPKRRGRPPGKSSKTRTPKTTRVSTPIDVTKLTDLVVSGHAMVAAATGFYELQITDDEASDLVKVSADLSAFYNYTPNPVVIAWVFFLMVIGKVYGTRALAIKNRLEREHADSKKSSVKSTESEKIVPIS